MKKRILSLALALAMCLGLMTVTASAASATLTEIVTADALDRLTPEFSTKILGFHEGITWTDGCAAFDTTGKVIVEPFIYKQVKEFSDGVAWAERDGVWCAVDNTGRELFSLEGAYAINGLSNFSDGLAKVYSREAGKSGYVDKTGRVAIPFEHNDYAGDFHDGLAVYYDSANAYYGYMDKTGKVVIPCQYTGAKDFIDGAAVVQLAGKRWTVINTTGQELIPQEYSYTDHWPFGITPYVVGVTGPDNMGYYVNRAGQIVGGGYDFGSPDDILGRFSDGLTMVERDGKAGYVNEAGVLVIPFQYSRTAAASLKDQFLGLATIPTTEAFHDGYTVAMNNDGTA